MLAIDERGKLGSGADAGGNAPSMDPESALAEKSGNTGGLIRARAASGISGTKFAGRSVGAESSTMEADVVAAGCSASVAAPANAASACASKACKSCAATAGAGAGATSCRVGSVGSGALGRIDAAAERCAGRGAGAGGTSPPADSWPLCPAAGGVLMGGSLTVGREANAGKRRVVRRLAAPERGAISELILASSGTFASGPAEGGGAASDMKDLNCANPDAGSAGASALAGGVTGAGGIPCASCSLLKGSGIRRVMLSTGFWSGRRESRCCGMRITTSMRGS